jgi:hypothetical protein
LPHHFLPDDYLKAFIHTVAACGYGEGNDEFLIDDCGATPFPISAERLAVARGAIALQKHRMLLVCTPAEPVDLPRAIEAGIRDCWTGLLESPIRNFGLPAIAKWGNLVADPRDKKGWPKAMPPGRKLHAALTGVYEGIETAGTGGGAMRSMYADFLDEAAGVTGRQELAELATEYRKIALMWSGLADAALPDSSRPLHRVKQLLARKRHVLEERGANGLDEAGEIARELASIEANMDRDFPLDTRQVDALLDDLAIRLRTLYAAEASAAECLKSLVA